MPETGGLPPNTMLNGRYILLEVIGQGGMGAVYKATDTKGKRVVAVKEMAKSKFDPSHVAYIQQRFQHEADILSKVAHPNIPRFYDYFHEAGRSYIVMEYIEGETLEDLQRQHPSRRLPVHDVLSYAEQLCGILNYLHHHEEQGRLRPIIYRDLKPANVMITKQKKAYLIDFGIARFLDENNNADPVIMGTKGYSPPEQFGNVTTEVSDLFSLGATLFVCLTGHNPQKNVPNLWSFPPIRTLNHQVPADVEILLRWMLATQATDRPQSAMQVLQELKGIKQRAAGITDVMPNPVGSGIGGLGSNFYDEKTARAAQYRVWLLQANKLLNVDKVPGLLGRIWASYLIPALSHSYAFVVGFLLKMYGGKALLDAFSEPVWTPHFWLIFLLSFLFSIGGSVYLINTLHTSPFVVAFYLASMLTVLTFTTGMHRNIKNQLSRSVLLAMFLLSLVLCASLLGLPAVQHTLQTATLNQFFCLTLIVLGGSTLIRPEGRLYWLDHVTITASAASVVLLQTILGMQEMQQLLPHTNVTVSQFNQYYMFLLIVPILIGVSALWKRSQPLGHFAHVLVFLLATLDMGLQLALGRAEVLPLLQHGTRTLQPSPELLYAVLAFGPLVVALIFTVLPVSSSRVGNFPLFVLAGSLAYIQNEVGTSFASPLSFLSTTLPKVFSFYQVVAYGLVALAILLLLRWRKMFTPIDHIAIFGIAVIAALLQSSAWLGNSAAQQRSGDGNASLTLLMTGLNEGMAWGLGILVVVLVIFTVLTIFFKLGHHARTVSSSVRTQGQLAIERWTGGIYHVMIVSASGGCFLLFTTFGKQVPLLMRSLPISNVALTGYNIVQVILAIITLFAFVRWLGFIQRDKGYGRSERFVMLFAAMVCAFLLFGEQGGAYIALAPPSLPQGMLQALPFRLLVFLSGLSATSLALLWLRNPWRPGDRGLLAPLFIGACAFALLQMVQPALLIASLILLMQGVLLATQIEKVR